MSALRATLFTGTSLCALALTSRAEVVLAQWFGPVSNGLFGNSVARVGDVNGDGTPDLVVGAPWESVQGPKSGVTRVLSGADGSVLRTFLGNSSGDEHGIAVAGVGDIDLDGFPDVLAGAHLDDATAIDSGTAYLYSGNSGAVLYAKSGTHFDDSLGAAVAGGSDFDHDGYLDFIVASHHDNQVAQHAGAVFVYSGQNGAPLRAWYGAAYHEDFGHSVAVLGDVDHDGTDDVLVGAHGYSLTAPDAGGAFVVSGATGARLMSVSGDSAADDMGRAVAAGGDIDLDGVPDAVVGIPQDDNLGPEAGAVRLFHGANGAILQQFDGDNAGDGLGQSVLGGIEIDGDGIPDVVLAAPGDDSFGLNTGRIRLHAGSTGSRLFEIFGNTPGVRFWRAFAKVDLDGDGAEDLVVADPYDDTAGIEKGAIRIYSGNQFGWKVLGSALPGALGAPKLSGKGYLGAQTVTTLALSNVPPLAPITLFVGFTAANLPLLGGTLVPAPDVVISGIPASPLGTLDLSAPWPIGVPSGVTIQFQEWILDPSGPLSVTASNALRITTP